MLTLKDALAEARKNRSAVGHFNISDIAGLLAIAGAAMEARVPVVIGTSEGEAGFVGYREAVALVHALREEHNHPIFLNADHTKSLEKVKEAIEAGYDSVIFDGSHLSFEENIRLTKSAVILAKSIDPEVIVEGEIGYIGSSSEVLKEIPKGASLSPEELTSSEEAKVFAEETGVDLLAPAVGNVHGIIVAEGFVEKLDISRIGEIAKAVNVPLVLHGASGLSGEDIRAAVAAGISLVHVNTELRVAWRKGMEEALKESPNEVAPYKLYGKAVEEMKQVVREKLALFG